MSHYREWMKEVEQYERDMEARRVAKAPDKNRTTPISEWPDTYTTHSAGETKRGARVVFGVSDHPNVAGCFLCWKETWTSGQSFTRTRFLAFDSHADAMATGARLAEEWQRQARKENRT